MSESRFPKEIQDWFRGKRVLVTGGTGMIGRSVCTQLAEMGAKVVSLSLDRIKLDIPCEQVKGDLRDFAFCQEMTKGMDAVLHVAGIKGSIEVTQSHPASFLVNLLMMNTNILEACARNGIQKVLYTSSIGAYASAEVFKEGTTGDEGPPMDSFPGWAKRMGELQVKAYAMERGLKYGVVRICNVYGPGDNFDPKNAMVIPSLMARIRAGENPLNVWGDGTAIRDFAYSDDVAEGVIRAAFFGTDGRYYNLGSGVGVPIREVIETLQKVIPFQAHFDKTKPSGFPKRVMDISLAREKIGFAPRTSLLEGFKKTWEWYKANPDESASRQNYFTEKH